MKRRSTTTDVVYCLGRVIGALLIIAVTTPVPLHAASSQGLERLFTTPEQRSRLDILRRQDGTASHQEASSPAISNASRLKINGTMMGSDGRRMLWVNGTASTSGITRLSTGTRVRLSGNGRVAVQRQDQRNAILLKAGQILDLGNGKVHEFYEKPDSSRAESDVVR